MKNHEQEGNLRHNPKVNPQVNDGRCVQVLEGGNFEKTLFFFMKRSVKIQKENKERTFHTTDSEKRHKKEKYREKKLDKIAKERSSNNHY